MLFLCLFLESDLHEQCHTAQNDGAGNVHLFTVSSREDYDKGKDGRVECGVLKLYYKRDNGASLADLIKNSHKTEAP